MSGYACSRCDKKPRTVVFEPCHHCYLCFDCYNLVEDKKKCNQCDKPVTMYLRIYTN